MYVNGGRRQRRSAHLGLNGKERMGEKPIILKISLENKVEIKIQVFLRIFYCYSIDFQNCKFGLVDKDYLGIGRNGEKLNVENSGIHSNSFKTFILE